MYILADDKIGIIYQHTLLQILLCDSRGFMQSSCVCKKDNLCLPDFVLGLTQEMVGLHQKPTYILRLLTNLCFLIFDHQMATTCPSNILLTCTTIAHSQKN